MSNKLKLRKEKFKVEFTDTTQTIKSLDPLQIKEYCTSKKILFDTKEMFLMFFTGQISQIYELTISECAILFEILNKYVGYKNIVYLSADAKKMIINELEIDPGSISKALKTLREKKILTLCEDDKHDKLNPFLFGEDEFQSIRQMETRITKKYNFNDYSICILESTIINQENEILESTPTRRTTDNQELTLALRIETNKELELRLQIHEAKLKLLAMGKLSREDAAEED